MNNIEFYIVIHDINTLLFFEQQKKYEKLKNYKYLLVGNHERDYSSDIIIQCNKLPNNIEASKNLLAYTGWYALAKNIKPATKYICLLEYDVDIDDTFNLDAFSNIIHSNNKLCYGISCMDLHDGIFVRTQFTHKMLDYLKDKGITQITPNSKKWLTTNNIIFQTDFFINYFNDKFVTEFFTYLDNDKMSGHFLERLLSIYCFINNIKFGILEHSGLVHRGFDSHNTQQIYNSERGYERFKATNKIPNTSTEG